MCGYSQSNHGANTTVVKDVDSTEVTPPPPSPEAAQPEPFGLHSPGAWLERPMPLEAGCSGPEGALVTWQEARGDRFCFFHLDESLIPPALIFSCEYQAQAQRRNLHSALRGERPRSMPDSPKRIIHKPWKLPCKLLQFVNYRKTPYPDILTGTATSSPFTLLHTWIKNAVLRKEGYMPHIYSCTKI